MQTAIVDEWDVPEDDAAIAAAIEALPSEPPMHRERMWMGLRGPSGGIYRVVLGYTVRDKMVLDDSLRPFRYLTTELSAAHAASFSTGTRPSRSSTW